MRLSRIILVLAAVMTAVCSNATPFKLVRIIGIDGQYTDIELNASVNLHFDNDKMIIECENNDITIPLVEILRWEYVLDYRPDVTTTLYENHRLIDGVLYLNSDEQHIEISVTATDGRVIISDSMKSGDSLDLNKLPKGLYIIKVGKQTMKVYMK